MFGRRFEGLDHSAYIGWRAIFHPSAHNPVDILPDRGSKIGNEDGVDEIIAWLNRKNERLGKSPWKWMVAQSKELSTSAGDYIQFIDGDFILEAGPQRSYGYLYIGAAKVEKWHDDFEPGVEAGITRYDSDGRRIDRRAAVVKVEP